MYIYLKYIQVVLQQYSSSFTTIVRSSFLNIPEENLYFGFHYFATLCFLVLSVQTIGVLLLETDL